MCMYLFCCVPQVSVPRALWTPALCCRLWCLVLYIVFALLAFLLIKNTLTCTWTQTSVLPRAFSHRTVTEIRQQTWVQRGSFATSVRETGVWRSTPGNYGKSLACRRQRRPASWSSSWEAWPSPSSPRCLTGSQRSRWHTA